MADAKKRLQSAVEGLLESKQDAPELIPAALGAYINGTQTIAVAARPGFVWCRLRSQTSERIMAFNAEPGVAHHWDLPILVTRDPKYPEIWKVAGRDVARYPDWGDNTSPYLPPHGRDHSFGGGTSSGNDITWAFKRQFMPLIPTPKPTGTLSIDIGQDFYYFGGRFHWFEGTGTATLDSYKPTGGYNARFVTIYIDGASGELDYLTGDEFNMVTPPVDPGEYISIPAPDTGFAVAAVWLATGTSAIGWRNIYDLRIPNAPPAGTGSLIGIYDEGTFMGGVRNFNFIGATINAVVSGTYAHVTVAGTGQGIFGLDDGVPLGTGTTVNWGDGLDASLSGTVFDVSVDEGYAFTWTNVHTFQDRALFGAVVGFADEVHTTGSVHVGGFIYMDDDDYISYDKNNNYWEFRIAGLVYCAITQTEMAYGYTDPVITFYQGGGVHVGRARTDPGQDNLRVQNDVFASGSFTTAEWLDTLDQADDPVAPAAGYGRWYSKGGIAYFEAPGGTIYDLTATGSGGGGVVPTTGTIVVSDEGVILGSATELDFIGAGVTAVLAGGVATIDVPGDVGTGTYVRAGTPVSLASDTGTAWQIPEGEFMTGTLSLMINGIWQEPVVDYQEQFPASGTFTLTEAPPTGSVFAVIWGAPDTSGGAMGPPNYGNCYGNEIGWTQAGAVQNTWYDISDANMQDGQLNGVLHDGNGQLQVTKTGRYAVDYAGSFEADGANVHIQIAFSVNGTEVGDGMNHFETFAADRQSPVAGDAILYLVANDTLNVSIRTTDAGAPDLTIDHLMLRVVELVGLGGDAGGITGSIDVYDDSVFQVEAHSISFDENLDVSVTGGYAYVDGPAAGEANDFVVIEDVLLTSDGRFNITIPTGTYAHLEVQMYLRSDNSGAVDAVHVQFNGATGSAYDCVIWGVDANAGGVGSGGDGVGVNHIRAFCTADTGPANAFSSVTLHVQHYANTSNHKVCQGDGFYMNTTAANQMWRWFTGGRWRSTAAISSIRIVPEVGDLFKAGSRVTVYGKTAS